MEEFQRFIKIIGEDAFKKINETRVLVVGVGGVGSYAVEALARSGIGTLLLIDFDDVDISNINRQLEALHSTIGKKKVDVEETRIHDISPNCQVISICKSLTSENITLLDSYNIDYIIDACDTIATKKALILYAKEKGISLLSCMGTGNKLDPSKLEIVDLHKTNYDPLAKILRKWARDERIKGPIWTVSSKEIPIKINERTPGSSAFVPSAAGLLCASYVICDIIKAEDY